MTASDDKRIEPLREWNRLARENTENAIVGSFFEAMGDSSGPLEKFSSWLLVGSAATAAFLIANSGQVLDFTTKDNFKTSAILLSLSCAFGLISRFFALMCDIQINMSKNLRGIFASHLAKYEKEEEEIQESAKFWGITLETGVRFERILTNFKEPMPKIVNWYVNRKSSKTSASPHADQHLFIKSLTKQSFFAFLQALMFLGFLTFGLFSIAQ